MCPQVSRGFSWFFSRFPWVYRPKFSTERPRSSAQSWCHCDPSRLYAGHHSGAPAPVSRPSTIPGMEHITQSIFIYIYIYLFSYNYTYIYIYTYSIYIYANPPPETYRFRFLCFTTMFVGFLPSKAASIFFIRLKTFDA